MVESDYYPPALVVAFGPGAGKGKDVGSPADLPALDQIKAISYDLEYAATNRTQLLKRFQDALIKTQ